MAKLTKDEVEHIAELARLGLTDKEKKLFQEQLSSILEYVNKLQEVDTSKVDPKAYILDVKNVTRLDEIKNCPKDSRDIIIKDFPEKKDNLCKVPPVL